MLTMPEFAQFLSNRYNAQNSADVSWVENFQAIVEERAANIDNDGWHYSKDAISNVLLKNFHAISSACDETAADAQKAKEFYTALKLTIEYRSASDLRDLFVKTTQASKI